MQITLNFDEDEMVLLDSLVKELEFQILNYYKTQDLTIAYIKYLNELPIIFDTVFFNNCNNTKVENILEKMNTQNIWSIQESIYEDIVFGTSSDDECMPQYTKVFINPKGKYAKFLINNTQKDFGEYFAFLRNGAEINAVLLANSMLVEFTRSDFKYFTIRSAIAFIIHYPLILCDDKYNQPSDDNVPNSQ